MKGFFFGGEWLLLYVSGDQEKNRFERKWKKINRKLTFIEHR